MALFFRHNVCWLVLLALGGTCMLISLMLFVLLESEMRHREGEDATSASTDCTASTSREQCEGSNDVLEPLWQQRQQNHSQLYNFRTDLICLAKDAMITRNASTDVQMLSLYDILPFDNTDGGVWKQGWPITYDQNKIREEKRLEVIVVPHSHTDPGWLTTFEGYFEEQTRHILDGMVQHLEDKPDLKFIYAEMSFFELWWSQQTAEVKKRVRKFLNTGQLEIVTGGWVMTDEANSHFFSTVMELFEGHEFLQNQLGHIPRHHWSIDPFGLSPTLSYVLNRANLTHMAVQRVHYAVKKHLARHRQLEFVWRQMFSTGDKSADFQQRHHSDDIVTHMFPFSSYAVPYSCGPDPKVCCQFDFRRLPQGPFSWFREILCGWEVVWGDYKCCPWGINPVPITAENVADRAQVLVDQYRKKAQLYEHNTILVPLGDDFRFDRDSEWTNQYSNYKALFEFMNSKREWNINARFGTLGDYFEVLERRLAEKQYDNDVPGSVRHSARGRGYKSSPASSSASLALLPVLSGDFFTYADRDDHYWSGFFTTRPFYKHMDRTLQHLLRAADIFYAMARWHSAEIDGGDGKHFDMSTLFDSLVRARRALSLFQHHDAVTGTARTHVMIDYGKKMVQALEDSKCVLAHSVQSLLGISVCSSQLHLRVDETYFVDRLPEKIVLKANSALVMTNPMGHPRREVICVHVDSVKRRVAAGGEEDGQGTNIPQQIGPVLFVNSEGRLDQFRDKFELCFVAELPPFGMVHYRLHKSEDMAHKVTIRQSINAAFESPIFELKRIGLREKTVSICNNHLNASFDASTGLLKSINQTLVELSFVHYGARTHNPSKQNSDDDGTSSGAYLFLPDGPAKPLPTEANTFLVVSGPIRKYIYIKANADFGIGHQIALDVDGQHLAILNHVNLANSNRGNVELAMRLRVPFMQEDNFFTDLNGFQMIRRRRQPQLPLQAHFYPMASAAFIEDTRIRLTLLGRQALGVANLQQGELQVMLDRRLAQNDGRGLGEGVQDNLLTESRFNLLLEHFVPSPSPATDDATIGFQSLAAHHSSLRLHYPPITLAGQLEHAASMSIKHFVSALRRPFPCNIHPVALRTLSHPTVYDANSSITRPRNEVALVLHRFGLECRLDSRIAESSCPTGLAETADGIDVSDVFHGRARTIRRGSLTLLYTNSTDVGRGEQIALEPMELATLWLQF
uniref:Alpha-mannosidase n=1 Tax=Globodera rostochiensis TaxID=31243 RepID=A0A914I3C6_GLORO